MKLPRNGGQGVLVPGGFILTAAHCIEWSTSGGMSLGDPCLEPVATKSHGRLVASVYAVEPVSDVAVLGCPDEQTFWKEAQAWESFCETTAPVATCVDEFATADAEERWTAAHLLTHRRQWTEVEISEPGFGPAGYAACLRSRTRITGGTSGGPIVNDAGLLLGVVSWSVDGKTDGWFDGAFPRPHRALPGWIWSRIEGAQLTGTRT